MKILLYFLLINFLSERCFAQEAYTERRQPSQFNKFIELTSIDYAIQSFDSIRFQKVNLNALLRKRVLNKGIRPLNVWNNGKIIYYEMPELLIKRFGSHYNYDMVPLFDSLGNLIPTEIKPEKYYFQKYLSDTFDVVHINEIFYVVKGKLSSYVPYVSPTHPVITSAGIYLGANEYFTTALNFKYNYKGNRNDKVISLGQSVKSIVFDSVPKTDMLKQLYGNNLLEAIWHDLFTGRRFYYVLKNKEIAKSELTTELTNYEMVNVPVYDSIGLITAYTLKPSLLNPSHFIKMEIVQDWYYNETQNIVTNKIKELILIGKYQADSNSMPEIRPILRIVY